MEPIRVQEDLELAHGPAVDFDVRDPRDALEQRRQIVRYVGVDLAEAGARAGYPELHDRYRGGIEGLDQGGADSLGELADGGRHEGGHLVGVAVLVGRRVEAHEHEADAVGAGGVEVRDAAQGGDRVLDRLGDLLVDHARRRARVDCRHDDEREIYGGEQVDPEIYDGNQPEREYGDENADGEDVAPHGEAYCRVDLLVDLGLEFADLAHLPPSGWARVTAFTAEPSMRPGGGLTITVPPGSTPEMAAVSPLSARMVIARSTALEFSIEKA